MRRSENSRLDNQIGVKFVHAAQGARSAVPHPCERVLSQSCLRRFKRMSGPLAAEPMLGGLLGYLAAVASKPRAGVKTAPLLSRPSGPRTPRRWAILAGYDVAPAVSGSR